MSTSDHSQDQKFDRNLKRKVIAILGVVSGLWGVIGAIVLVQPAQASIAFMAGVSATGIVTSVIGAE